MLEEHLYISHTYLCNLIHDASTLNKHSKYRIMRVIIPPINIQRQSKVNRIAWLVSSTSYRGTSPLIVANVEHAGHNTTPRQRRRPTIAALRRRMVVNLMPVADGFACISLLKPFWHALHMLPLGLSL